MYSVMIVDDEKTIREKLPLLIPFEEHGFTVRASARNGEEAWALLPTVRPALILLDIRMPVMDGLAFLQKLRGSEYADVQVIILSGYGEFSYAQKAIVLGIRGYLTKPVDEEEAEPLLDAIREELAQKEQARQKQNYQAVRHALRQAYENDTAIAPHPDYFILHIALCGMLENRDNQTPVETLGNVLQEMTQLSYNAYMKHEKGVYTYVLPVSCMVSGDTGAFCATLRRKIAKAGLICQCMADTVSLTQPSPSYRQRYNQTWYALLTNAFYGEADADTERTDSAVALEPLVNELRRAIWKQDETTVFSVFGEIGAYLEGNRVSPLEVYVLSQKICAILQETAWHHSENHHTDNCYIMPVWSEKNRVFLTFDVWKSLERQQLSEVLDYIRQVQKASSEGLSGELMEYVQQNYMQALSLQSVAEVFHMNAAYLGRVFQRATGENFRQYVNHLRIAQAKHLLKSTDLMIYEIAERVGFSDSAYFVSRFTTTVGMTPLEFRKK